MQAHDAAARQIGAHPVLVTTIGYQAGAKTYAEDEDVTLLVLRRFQESDLENRLMELAMNVHLTFRVGPHATLHPDAPEQRRLVAQGLRPPFEVSQALLQWEDAEVDLDGERRALLEVLREIGADDEVGSRRIELPEPLPVPYFGEPVLTPAITWTTQDVPVTQRIVAGRGLGPPELLIVDAVGTDLTGRSSAVISSSSRSLRTERSSIGSASGTTKRGRATLAEILRLPTDVPPPTASAAWSHLLVPRVGEHVLARFCFARDAAAS